MANERDYYDILGVQRGATDEELKRAFRKLAQQWHPDVSTEPGADLRFKEINEAYQVLSDSQRRQAYDMFGRAGVGGAGSGGDPFGAGGFQGFGDLFDAFFGAGAGTGTRRGRPPAGSDLRYDLRLTFAEAISGADKEIEFSAMASCDTCAGSGAEPGTTPVTCPQCSGTGEVRQVRSTMLGQMVNVTACGRCRGLGRIVESPCKTCRGDGRVERKRTLRVAVPAGIDEGHQIRLSGEGEAGPRGGPPGNLYVVTHVEPHPQLKRQETELYFELDVSITQASLGARVSVPTPDGEEWVEVRPGTQPGTEIRLRGKGVPHLRRSGARGDLHVLVDVRVPSRLSSRQRELLEELAVESGELAEDRDDGADGSATNGSGPAPRSGRRRKSGIRDRLKDAIS
ncbi:MAG: molecular chaperone DnaJ [Candidatus Limnocylindrales bacterium]